MKLNKGPFYMIKSGLKTIELRLFDDKRQAIQIGDHICFHRYDKLEETIEAQVVHLYHFQTFEELYQTLPLLSCGYTKDNINQASAHDMIQYYSLEQQKKYGVVGIEIRILK